MDIGKLNWEDLKAVIDENKGSIRQDVVISGGIGEDCSIINYGDYDCIVSTDPITGAEKGIGKLAVNINCNDIASAGVEPVGILVTIMVPPSASMKDIREIMSEISGECKKLKIQVLGGHTEVTDAVNRTIVSCTVIGKGKKNKAVITAGSKIGDDIIVTKTIGMEGTYIAINEKYSELKDSLSNEEIMEAKAYGDKLSVVEEGKLAGEFGVSSMHDITEGGLLGALWEVASAAGVGFKIYSERIPLSSVTRKVAQKFNIDPLRFIASGSMLICCKNGDELVNVLKKEGIPSVVIGKITKEKGIIINGKEQNEVEMPKCDELFKIYRKK